MMLDINYVELRQGFLQYLPVGALIGVILLVELLFVFAGWAASPDTGLLAQAPIPSPETVSNTRALGRVIYTNYAYLFQAAGMVLLTAMIGAIVLTLRSREGVRRQSIARQIGRSREDSVEIKKVETGKGI
jgi:NADH-quinone oxidoreductase subunit J